MMGRREGEQGQFFYSFHLDKVVPCVPGIGPIISSAMVAATGAGDVFTKGRDFAAWLGLVPKQISTGDRTILGKLSSVAIATCGFCSCRRRGSC